MPTLPEEGAVIEEPVDSAAAEPPTAAPDRAVGHAPDGLTAPPASAVAAPIVIDLGRRRRKQINQLKRGAGPLAKEVAEVVEQVRSEVAKDLAGPTLLPVVVIYRKPRRRARSTIAAALGAR